MLFSDQQNQTGLILTRQKSFIEIIDIVSVNFVLQNVAGGHLYHETIFFLRLANTVNDL